MIIPETLELIEVAIYLAFSPGYIFMLPVSIYVTDNMYGLRPIYYANVNINESIKTKIEIYNPTENDIFLYKAYSTEDFVKLSWLSKKQQNMSQIVIPAKSTKHVLTA